MKTDTLDSFIPKDIQTLYEFHNSRNAAQVLATGCRSEFEEIIECLLTFRLTLDDIRKPGGNESEIPKRISSLLREKGWKETRIKGDLLITKISPSTGKRTKIEESFNKEDSGFETIEEIEEELNQKECYSEEITLKNFLDGHKVDYVKHRVAFDLEWNSKDQTFDRDLYAFRAFHECNLIDAAVLLTRGVSLNAVFEKLGAERDKDGKEKTDKNGNLKLIKTKYGASTTWMGKLLPRLNAGRNGGCPVLAFGITPNLITDWIDYEKQPA